MTRPPDDTAPARLAVAAVPADDSSLAERAASLAAELALPYVETATPPTETDLLLLTTPKGLSLQALRGPTELTQGKPFTLDLRHIDTTTGPGRSLRQPLLRAIGLRKGDPYRPRVLDATAGLGEDAWLLAGMGCDVLAVERHPVVAAMLRDAVARAGREQPEVEQRLHIVTSDSAALLDHLATGESPTDRAIEWPWEDGPEVIYIDPMFPAGRKTMERKPMRLLRRLVGADVDAARLLPSARRAARRRVVVKRSPRAEPLAGEPPAATHRGRSVRYDVYPAQPQ